MVNRTLRELTAEDVCKIACTYQNMEKQRPIRQYEDERGFCKATQLKTKSRNMNTSSFQVAMLAHHLCLMTGNHSKRR